MIIKILQLSDNIVLYVPGLEVVPSYLQVIFLWVL